MPAIPTHEAVERLARVVETAKPTNLREIYAELFPEKPVSNPLVAGDIARHIRGDLAAEEIVDLWNVVFPEDHNVRYDEETEAIRFNEELVGYVD